MKPLAFALTLIASTATAQAASVETKDPYLQGLVDSILGGCLDDAEAMQVVQNRYLSDDNNLSQAPAAEVRDAIAGVLNTPAENVTAEQPGPQTEIGAVTVKAQGTYQSLPIVSYSLSLPCECGFSFWAVGFDAPEEDVAKVFADDLKAARQRVKEVLQGEGDGLEIGIERNTQAPGAPTQLYCAWST
ncbi:hypothetical protein AB7M35_000909 [Amorphus suaedae]